MDRYRFIRQQGNIVCLLCRSTVAVAKISNVKCHYESKHKDFQSVVGEERTAKIQSLCHSPNQQQKVFTERSADFDASCEVRYDISLVIAKSGQW